jgi:hypothetical protein
MNISPVTRRDIIDAQGAESVTWSGRLEEPEFLSRLFDLKVFHRLIAAIPMLLATYGSTGSPILIGMTIGFSTIAVSIY